MPRCVAFLRAINVGGHIVTMDRLRREFETLGLKQVDTFIASGNVIFVSASRDRAALERQIEKRLNQALGYEVATFVRTEGEVAAIARHRPFTAAQLSEGKALNVGFLAEPLTPVAVKTLLTLQTDNDTLRAHGREVYWLCRTRQGESAFSNAALEKALNLRATFRGQNTLTRMVAKYGFAV